MKKGSIIKRALTIWLITTFSIYSLSAIMQKFEVADFGAALAMSGSIALINALFWPALIRLALPLTVLTMGLGVLLLNGFIVLLAGWLLGERILLEGGVGTATIVALGVTVINLSIMSILDIEDNDLYYLGVVKRKQQKNLDEKIISKSKTGTLFLEIDGLAYDVLIRAMRDGNAPTLAKWLREGSHKLIKWETDWSSQTGAMQAGILHGNNSNMPAFRWWEKASQKAMVSNHPKDAMEIERRQSNGKGLLSNNGASRANLLSGDAPHSLLTMSTILRRDRKGRIGQDYYTFFANPYNLLRTIILSIQDIFIELWQASQQKRLDVLPRVHRGLAYSLLRSWTTVLQRDLQAQAVIGDVLLARPIVYTTFLGYDEVAHHSGVERPDALSVLRKIDRQFKRIESALQLAPIKYEIVILSDHGQTQGSTFLQRYGTTLEALVEDFSKADVTSGGGQGDEGRATISASVTEISRGDNFLAKSLKIFKRNKQDKPEDQVKDIVVMSSGCLGLVYFNNIKGRANLEEIDKYYPDLMNNLVNHPGIGFVMVNTKARGPVAIGSKGRHFLSEGKIEGKDPLKNFGQNAVKHLLRTNAFNNCADIMINSTYWPVINEVAAFEELVGSHGGLGGTQNYPFVLYPASWTAPKADIVGAEQLHKQLVSWTKAS